MMVQMLGVFAEFERALIVERITAGLERKAARGGWCGGRRPYGYDIAEDRDHLQRNPTEAPLIPVIFDHYVNGQLGSTALATWLNEHGYRTKNGRLWSRARVLTVLRNRSYLGEIYYRGSWYPAPQEPLIPTELFDRAQAILKERGEDRSQRRSNASEYLLTGRVRCGRCGQAYVGTAAHGRNGRYTYYTCFTRHRYGTEHCGNDRLPAEQLEQAVTRRLWKVLDDRELLDRAITQAYERLTQTRRRAAIRAHRHTAQAHRHQGGDGPLLPRVRGRHDARSHLRPPHRHPLRASQSARKPSRRTRRTPRHRDPPAHHPSRPRHAPR
jgi:site-specific DNA recombinase